jgi:hypothetical protein
LQTQDHGFDVVERAMRAVDARDVHAGRVEARKGFVIDGLRTNRADETRFDGTPPRVTAMRSVREQSKG